MDKYLDFAWELKKLRVPVKVIMVGVLGTVPKGFDERLEKLEIKEKNRNHPDYSIVEIGQNTRMSPGDLRKIAATQTPMKDHQR